MDTIIEIVLKYVYSLCIYLTIDNKMILFYNQINADEIVSWIYNCAYINEKQ